MSTHIHAVILVKVVSTYMYWIHDVDIILLCWHNVTIIILCRHNEFLCRHNVLQIRLHVALTLLRNFPLCSYANLNKYINLSIQQCVFIFYVIHCLLMVLNNQCLLRKNIPRCVRACACVRTCVHVFVSVQSKWVNWFPYQSMTCLNCVILIYAMNHSSQVNPSDHCSYLYITSKS